MSKKVKKFGRAAVETAEAAAKYYGGLIACAKCGFSMPANTVEEIAQAWAFFEFDHVFPESFGGNSRRENCAVICGAGPARDGCNQLKGETLPEQFYTAEQIEAIRAIQQIPVTQWEDVKRAIHAMPGTKAFAKRFPLK